MTIINPNSISGISSITALNSTAAINLFKADGTAANIIAGVTTGANFITGTSNVHSTGYECTRCYVHLYNTESFQFSWQNFKLKV